MNPILFNAAKGAERAMHAQHARANNLSNVDTVGFKSLMEFTTPQRLQGSGFDGSVTTRTNLSLNDFTQGNLLRTGRSLDVALSGEGFFSVEGKVGELPELYTRTGQFEMDSEGAVRVNGRAVLTDGGPLVLPDHQDIAIGDDGVVSVVPLGGDGFIEIGVLKVVSPEKEQVTLDKTGLFRSLDGQQFAGADNFEVKSGYLEGSNVSGFGELVGIMNLTRQFEVQVKVMSKADELAKIGNELMRV